MRSFFTFCRSHSHDPSRSLLIVCGALCLLLPAAGAQSGAKGASTMAFTLRSPDFASTGDIPKQFTCSGEDRSPALEWSGAPAGTKSFALIVDDPDAPAGVWVHWVIFNIPGARTFVARRNREKAATRGWDASRTERLRQGWLQRPMPTAGETASLFFQALCTGWRTVSWFGSDQGRG